ncbi:endonuclease domain-containing protein [Algoriphagus halophilus]|uniref:DUF559 domain-containing protein n=1 Tax=Algoriphagus halophilus TaxID=226505 RepID=A0A1N6D3W8_9BACT|nr:DUF559 domain-containing protein [Algoriphagus halophilus]SIN65407.1 Protein of unknown function [Algoriphagus halophilus]
MASKSPFIIRHLKPDNKSLNQKIEYIVYQNERGNSWNYSSVISEDQLIALKKEIDNALDQLSLADRLKISEEDSTKLQFAFDNDPLCTNCSFKMKYCKVCFTELQSPLERKLFLALKKTPIYFEVQFGISRSGKNIHTKNRSYDHPTDNFKEVLTIADFFINQGDQKLCIYTDGHTYHERTEEQALKDRNIDRQLQQMGYNVLRYTGKEINESLDKVVSEIEKWYENVN